MTIDTGPHALSGKAHWRTKVVTTLTAGRWMIFGALILVVIEKWRRGVFTNDDAVGLMLLWLVVYFVEMSLKRRLLSPPTSNGDA